MPAATNDAEESGTERFSVGPYIVVRVCANRFISFVINAV